MVITLVAAWIKAPRRSSQFYLFLRCFTLFWRTLRLSKPRPLFAMNTSTRLRIWDLPTRLFHWLLVVGMVALLVTSKIGGDAMAWHLRLGQGVLALLVFRVLWGVVGGYWSRFLTFVPSPQRLLAYLRGQGTVRDEVGHNPLGALSVLGMLGIIGLQVFTGLLTDDEIFYAGPLTGLVSGDTVAWATTWHKTWGQWLLLGAIALHVLALVFYSVVQKKKLVPAMVHGDKEAVPAGVPASRDGWAQRLLALVVLAVGAGAAWWVWQLGGPGF